MKRWWVGLCCPFPNLACCCQAGGHQRGRGDGGERADTKSRASSKGAALLLCEETVAEYLLFFFTPSSSSPASSFRDLCCCSCLLPVPACSISCGGRSCFFSLFGLAASFRHFPGPLPGQITHQSLPPGAGSNLQPHLPRAERNLWRFSPIFFAGHFETPFFHHQSKHDEDDENCDDDRAGGRAASLWDSQFDRRNRNDFFIFCLQKFVEMRC